MGGGGRGKSGQLLVFLMFWTLKYGYGEEKNMGSV